MKILITGDKRWSDSGLVREIIELYDPKQTVIALLPNPIAPLITVEANKLSIPVQMVEGLEGIDYLLVFHKYIRGSKSCKALIKEASNLKIPYQIVGSAF